MKMASESDKSMTELSETLRKFFIKMLGISNQFNMEELDTELAKRGVGPESITRVDNFFKGLEELRYSGEEVDDQDSRKMMIEASAIVREMSGFAAKWADNKPETETGEVGGLKKGIIGLKKALRLGSTNIQKESGGKAATPEGILNFMPKKGKSNIVGEKLPKSLSLIFRDISKYENTPVKLRGRIFFVNRMLNEGNFWYMFSDDTANMVSLSKATDRYSGKGTLTGTIRKTLTEEVFIEIDHFIQESEINKDNKENTQQQ